MNELKFNMDVMKRVGELLKEGMLTEHDAEMSVLYLIAIYSKLGFNKQILSYTPAIMAQLELAGLVTVDTRTKSEYVYSGPPLYLSRVIDEPVEPVSKINKTNVVEFVHEHAQELRNIFSKEGKGKRALRSGAMGDMDDLIKKLIEWFKKTKYKYSWEQVLSTAKAYVNSCTQDNYKYLQAADYFVKKDGRSRLSSMIDEFGGYKARDTQLHRHNTMI